VQPLLVSIKIRLDIGALLAASLTGEQRFNVGQANMIPQRSALISTEWAHL
jgi:hypothetical protein